MGIFTPSLERLYRLMALHSIGLRGSPSQWSPLKKTAGAWATKVWIEFPELRMRAAGFSTDPSPRLACVKAVMEALESLAAHRSSAPRANRNGLAAHFSKKAAQERAYWELVERDGFIFHWLSETPGGALPSHEQRRLQHLQRRLPGVEKIQGLTLSLADPMLSGVFLRARPRHLNCWLLGLGVRPTLREAFEKARLELLGGIATHLDARICPSLEILKSASDSEIAKDFLQAHLNSQRPETQALLEHLFQSTVGEPGPRLLPTSLAETQFKDLSTQTSRYFVVCAENPKLLPIFFGSAFQKSGNQQRYLSHPALDKQSRMPRFHSSESFVNHPMD